jgi:hypothetical protein
MVQRVAVQTPRDRFFQQTYVVTFHPGESHQLVTLADPPKGMHRLVQTVNVFGSTPPGQFLCTNLSGPLGLFYFVPATAGASPSSRLWWVHLCGPFRAGANSFLEYSRTGSTGTASVSLTLSGQFVPSPLG